VRRALPLLVLPFAAAACGPSHSVRTADAIQESRVALRSAGIQAPTTEFPASAGSRSCTLARVNLRARCSTAADRVQDGAVVVTFTAAWRSGRHTWTFTVVPGGAGGPRGPYESGPAPWKQR
jgi:hypothetical protein